MLVVSWLLSVRFSRQPDLSVLVVATLGGNLVTFYVGWRQPREQFGGLLDAWVITAIVVAANGLLRLGTEPEFLSTLGNRNFLGAYLAASVVLAFGAQRRTLRWAVILLLGALWFCQSRSAWFGLGVAAAIWLVVSAPGRWRLAVCVAIALGAWLVLRVAVDQWSQDVRPLIWRGSVRMMMDRPVVGHGLGTFVAVYPAYRPVEYFLLPKAAPVTDHAHNELLEVAAEQGLLGMVATIGLWMATLHCGVRARQWVLVGALVVFMVHGLLDVGLRYAPNQQLFWLLLGMTAGSSGESLRWRSRLPGYTPARWLLATACLFGAVATARFGVIDALRAAAWDRRARLAQQAGDLERAAVAAAQALDIQPQRLSTRYLLAGVLAGLPLPEARQQAIMQCEQLREIAPDYADVNYNVGMLYLMNGEAARATPRLRRALELNPFDPRLLQALRQAQQGLKKLSGDALSGD